MFFSLLEKVGISAVGGVFLGCPRGFILSVWEEVTRVLGRSERQIKPG